MTEPTKPLYTPALGSQAAIGMAHIRSMHPAPVSGSDLAELLHCDSKNVFQAMRRCVEYGLITLNKVGVRNVYQLTAREALNGQQPEEVTAEQLQAYAKRAVIMLRGQTKSSVDLAAWCNTSPAVIDKALADQVTAGHLVRVDVLRGGQTMFDYRWGATYVPKDADFDQAGHGQVPEPRVQPVEDKALPPKPKKAPGKPTNPASPWRQEGNLKLPGSPDLKPRDALASGADLGRKDAAADPAPAPVSPLPITPEVNGPNSGASQFGWVDQMVEPEAQHAIDLNDEDDQGVEFSITHKGTLYIDSISGQMTQLSAREALALKRFLDNTSILEELAAGGAL